MTIIEPITTLKLGDITLQPFPDVVGFTLRDAASYDSILSTIRVYLRDVLVPYLQDNSAQAIFQENVDTVIDTVNANMLEAVHDVVTGSIPITDAAVAAVLSAATSASKTVMGTAFGFTMLQGAGIDPIGATDSTAGVQAFFAALADGTHVMVPGNAIITLSATINVTKRVKVTGSGELRWTAGIASSAMFLVTAGGCHFDQVYLTNPNHLAAASGNRTAGIEFKANSGRVTNSRIVGQQQAIMVEATGEYHDFFFNGNFILDVPGNGGGAADTTTNVGEDRGDGIVVWGATAIITDNRVAALDGTDARIGIHTEGLPTFEATPYAYGDSSVNIANNIVTGRFRRGIASETVAGTSITGNKVWDATWWGIAIIGGSHGSVIADNRVFWTRTSTDNQGGAWTPQRCGIMVYGQNSDSIVHDNIVTVMPNGVLSSGICVQAANSGTPALNLNIHDNRVTDPANGIGVGINFVNGGTDCRLTNNIIDGLTATGVGVNGFKVDKLTARGNKIKGSGTATGTGISLSSTGTWARLEDNYIENVGVGIKAFSRSVFVAANNNIINTATTGIDFFGTTTGSVTANSNTFVGVTGTKLANVPTGTVQVGNN